MTRITARRLSFGAAAGLGLLVLAAAPAQAVECGDVITGQARLDRDLICTIDPINSVPALTVDGGRLDLGRFTVVCDPQEEEEEEEPSVAVLLDGQGARLRGGAVTGCDLAIWVAGSGGHIVRNVTASASNQGVFIESDGNRLLNSAVLRGFVDAAVQINGDNNIARFNAIAGSSDQGFEVNGSNNRIVGNRIGGVGEGIQLVGNGNHVLRNHIIGALERGVEVREGAHVIAFNLIADGGTDRHRPGHREWQPCPSQRGLRERRRGHRGRQRARQPDRAQPRASEPRRSSGQNDGLRQQSVGEQRVRDLGHPELPGKLHRGICRPSARRGLRRKQRAAGPPFAAPFASACLARSGARVSVAAGCGTPTIAAVPCYTTGERRWRKVKREAIARSRNRRPTRRRPRHRPAACRTRSRRRSRGAATAGKK